MQLCRRQNPRGAPARCFVLPSLRLERSSLRRDNSSSRMVAAETEERSSSGADTLKIDLSNLYCNTMNDVTASHITLRLILCAHRSTRRAES